ncbi:MAG: FHA domain-containing protein [Pseudomonadota bacterium]
MDTSLTHPSSLEWQFEAPQFSAVNQHLLSGLRAGWVRLRNAAAQLFAPAEDSALVLLYGNEVLRFPTPREFAFALAHRSEYPRTRVAQFESMTTVELRRAVRDIRHVEVEFSKLLSDARQSGSSMRALLADFDLRTFSSDHDWRSLFGALSQLDGARHDEFRRVAVQHYARYLASRRGVLQELRIARQRDEVASARTPSYAVPAQSPPPRAERVTLDTPAGSLRGDDDAGYLRLPESDAVTLSLVDPKPLRVFLSAYPFRIERHDGRLCVVDGNSRRATPLVRGRNVVGRGKGCEVVVDNDYREVSREHLIIDVIDSGTLRVSDVSSHGTTVPLARVLPN